MLEVAKDPLPRNSEHALVIQQRLAQQAPHYNRWIYETIRPYLGRRIADIGCALGNITQYFVDTDLVIGVDIDPDYLTAAAVRCTAMPRFITHLSDAASQEMLALKSHRLDTITCLNVLEHIEDDHRALNLFCDILVPGGRVVLLVPALKVLYGSMDRADLHFRRYSRSELRGKLNVAGLWLERLFFFNWLSAFGWFVNGRILCRTVLPEGQLTVYDRLVPLLQRLERRIRPPFGQSLIAIGRKDLAV